MGGRKVVNMTKAKIAGLSKRVRPKKFDIDPTPEVPEENEKDTLLSYKERSNSLNHDEFRLSATFNYTRVMGYLTLVDDVVKTLNGLAHGKAKVGLSRNRLMLEVVSLILSKGTGTR